jgi:hypothetical protein
MIMHSISQSIIRCAAKSAPPLRLWRTRNLLALVVNPGWTEVFRKVHTIPAVRDDLVAAHRRRLLRKRPTGPLSMC